MEQASLKVIRIPGGPLYANSYLIFSPSKREGILIDATGDEVFDRLEDIEVREILLTHCHFDHILALGKLTEGLGIGYRVHREELSLLRAFPEKVRVLLGLEMDPLPEPTLFLEEGEVVPFLDWKIKVLHTPGHSPGGLSFHLDNWLFTGDTLFRESVGRTDFPESDEDAFKDSLRRLAGFPDDTVVFPGHGPRTTMGHEKKNNGFLRWFLNE